MTSDTRQIRPLISVIIPTYQRSRALQDCLDSLERQHLPAHRFEILVVDNGSDPPAAPRMPANARLLRCEVPGSYAARNRALNEARGTYVAFTDDDCRPAPDWLEKGLEVLGPRRIAAGRIEMFFARDRPGWSERYDAAVGMDVREFVTRRNHAITANLMVEREAFDEVGPFREEYFSGEDTQWVGRAVEQGYDLRWAPDVVVAHPARAWPELRDKTRRIAAGVLAKEPSQRHRRHLLLVFLSLFSPRIRQTLKILHRVRYRPHHALAAWAITWGVRWVRLRETVRIMRGGQPLR